MFTKEEIEFASTPVLVNTRDWVGDRAITLLTIAAACHQQNRTYCQMLGDESQPEWSEAPKWQRESAIAGVKAALVNPDPETSHKGWLAEKEADGWVYGKTKDVEAKTHPCMVPYSDLPKEQKRKDAFFVSMVQQLGLASGLIRIGNLKKDT